MRFPRWRSGKGSVCQCRRQKSKIQCFNYSHHSVHHIPRMFSFYDWKLYLLTSISLSAPPHSFWEAEACSLYEFSFSRYHIYPGAVGPRAPVAVIPGSQMKEQRPPGSAGTRPLTGCQGAKLSVTPSDCLPVTSGLP